MRITPLDIRKQEFRKTMRGLDADEVYAFLSTVAEEYESVLSSNKNLRERIVDLEGRLQEYKKIETNLRNTLLTAERVTNETKENARREASLIVREAEVEAEKAAEAIRAHTQELRREVLELKRQKDNYLTRFKTLLESHHRVLDGFQEDFANIDKEIEEIGQQVEEDLNKGVPTPRISRQKITEEFGHAPKDKVTWGDEPKREETPRPGMPKQGAGGQPAPDGFPFPSGDGPADEQSKQVSDAQTTLLTDEDRGPKGIDVGSIGALGAMAGASPDEPVTGRTEAAPKAGQPQATRSPRAERGGEEVRRSVARSIEEQLYPGVVKEPDGNVPRDRTDAPDGVQSGQSTDFPAESSQDQWKQYDVQDKKPDWKGYDLGDKRGPGAAVREPGQKAGERQPADRTKSPHDGKRSRGADDSEVEEALSGLKEVPGAVDEPPSADEVVTLDEEAAVEEREPQAREKSPEQRRAAQPTGSQPKGKETEWSMEELRKNLSSLNRDEGN